MMVLIRYYLGVDIMDLLGYYKGTIRRLFQNLVLLGIIL